MGVGEDPGKNHFMRTLILTSDGLSPEIAKELFSLLGKKPEEVKLGFVANAIDPDIQKPESAVYLLQERASFEVIGIQDVIDVDLRIKEDLAKLDDCDVVYVGGGNTFYLLKLMRDSGFDKKIKELLSNDKMYVGVSAGSIVMGTSIETAGVGPAADANDVKLEDPRGLRHVPFMVAPHLTAAEKIYYDQFARTRQLRPIVGIEDGMAIICEGDRYRIVGPGKVLTWHSKLFR